jgi:hypothetical protein
MPALLVEFQDFYREHSESWLDKFSFHESGKQLLLMAFLQRIVNGGAKPPAKWLLEGEGPIW